MKHWRAVSLTAFASFNHVRAFNIMSFADQTNVRAFRSTSFVDFTLGQAFRQTPFADVAKACCSFMSFWTSPVNLLKFHTISNYVRASFTFVISQGVHVPQLSARATNCSTVTANIVLLLDYDGYPDHSRVANYSWWCTGLHFTLSLFAIYFQYVILVLIWLLIFPRVPCKILLTLFCSSKIYTLLSVLAMTIRLHNYGSYVCMQ